MKIKKLDQGEIYKLYESMKYTDYLYIDESETENYDWDAVFNRSDMICDGAMLLEDVDKIQDNLKTEFGTEDIYQITTKSGKTFKVLLNYWSPEYSKESSKIREAQTDKYRKDLLDKYSVLSNELGPSEYVCLIQFLDSDGRYDTTGNVGTESHDVFASVRMSFLYSMRGRNHSNLRGIVMRVSNKEKRRIGIYQMMIKRYLSKDYPNVFIDDYSEKDGEDGGFTLLYATR